MIKGALAKGFQDRSVDAAPSKSQTIATRVLALALEGDVEFFHNDNNKAFVSFWTEAKGIRTIALNSSEAAYWLRSKYYRKISSSVAYAAVKRRFGNASRQKHFSKEKSNLLKFEFRGSKIASTLISDVQMGRSLK